MMILRASPRASAGTASVATAASRRTTFDDMKSSWSREHRIKCASAGESVDPMLAASDRDRTIEPEESGRRVDEDDPACRRIGDPAVQVLETPFVGHRLLMRDERPVARPYELFRSARLEQRIDIRAAIRAALTVRRRKLDP